MKYIRIWIYSIVLFMSGLILLPGGMVSAKEQNIPYTDEDQEKTVIVGDTGQFEIPETVTSGGIEKKVQKFKIRVADEEEYNDWWDDSYDSYDWEDEAEEVGNNTFKVDKEGKFTALAPGKVKVTMLLYVEADKDEDEDVWSGWNIWNEEDEEYSSDDITDDMADDVTDDMTDDPAEISYDTIKTVYTITVKPDMAKVTIKNTTQKKYIQKSIWGYYDVPSYTFTLNSKSVLSQDDSVIDVSFSSSNSKIRVSGELYNNTVTLYPSDKGSTTVTVTICGKKFKVKIQTVVVAISKNSLLLEKGKSQKLKISGVSTGVKWSSSNKNIASISSNGTIKGKKTGNVVIKAKIGDISLGCAVSVVTGNRLKVVKRAIQIGKTCTYSQPKRMQSKYYDCSSLVWKAYSKYGQNFGNRNYAPVAADLGKWCADRKKIVKGGITYQNVQKMKFNPGDLYFCTGSNNKRYKGIYHVEMISGYVCYGFDSNGKPILEVDYANRAPGKYSGGMVGQP